jgi:hypothetical protein
MKLEMCGDRGLFADTGETPDIGGGIDGDSGRGEADEQRRSDEKEDASALHDFTSALSAVSDGRVPCRCL